MSDLRPYQSESVVAVKESLAAGNDVVLQMPTGAGKTKTGANLLDIDGVVWFVCHRREIVRQTSAALTAAGIPHAVAAPGHKRDPLARVQVCSVGSIARRMKRYPAPYRVIWDECVAGDTMVVTDVGDIRIDEIPHRAAKTILTPEGMRPIGAWRRTAKKQTVTISCEGGRKITCTLDHLVMTTSGWVQAGTIKRGHALSSLVNHIDRQSLEHCLETGQYRCQTVDQNRHAFLGRTQPNRPNGPLTRRNISTSCRSHAEKQKTAAMETEAYRCCRDVPRHSDPYTTSSNLPVEKNPSALSGSNQLATSDSHGGFAMTGVSSRTVAGSNLAPTDSAKTETRSSETGWKWSSAIAECIDTSADIGTLDFQWTLPRSQSNAPTHMSRPACDTNWVKVESVETDVVQWVYDISVPGPECFFGNGLLVHNCHHIGAGTWSRLKAELPNARHIGLTATPHRGDKQGLEHWFDDMIVGPSIAQLIRDGFLSPYRLFAPSRPSLDAVPLKRGDYSSPEADKIMRDPRIVGDAVATYLKRCAGKRALAFATSVAASAALVERFMAAGVPARHVDGKTPVAERDAAVADLAAGRILVLSNYGVFTEGFDLPAIDAVILLRPTKSLSLYLQMIGRGLRIADGKDVAFILDHAGCVFEHGLPDAPIEWTLAGGARRDHSKRRKPVLLTCPKCGRAHKPEPTCPECGHRYKDSVLKEAIEGELEEFAADQAASRADMEAEAEAERIIAAAMDTFVSQAAFGRIIGKAPAAVARMVLLGLPTNDAGEVQVSVGLAWVETAPKQKRAPRRVVVKQKRKWRLWPW